MYDKAKTRRKFIGISCIALVMACLLYVYDAHADKVYRQVHAAMNALSPFRMLKESLLKKEFEHGGPIAQPEPAPWSGVPVLLYHGIVKQHDRFNMTEETFKDQMFTLKRAGYQTVTLSDFQSFMRGEKILPPKSFLLTFDDGRADSYEGADPILKTVGFNAVMYVATGASMPTEDVRWSYYISPNDIKDMLGSGRWEIGSHAIQEGGGYVPIDADGQKANFLSSRMWLASKDRLETSEEYAARVGRELGGSKRELDQAFGTDVRTFAYPFGDYGLQEKNNDEAIDVIARTISLSYDFAFRQVWPEDGEYGFNHTDVARYRLKRFETPTDWSGAQLLTFMESARDKSLPYHEDFSAETGWHGTWGEVLVKDYGLSVLATPKTTGAAAFLDGTHSWKDYAFTAVLDRLKGSHVSLLARYKDAGDYLVCTYGAGRVKIERFVDGVPEKLAEVRTDEELPPRDATIGVLVQGGTIECLVNQDSKVSASVPDEMGGIGVGIWDKELGNAGIVVKRAIVTPL